MSSIAPAATGKTLLNLKSSEHSLNNLIKFYAENQRTDQKNQIGTDVLLICNDGVIPAHASILNAVSPFFRDIFKSQTMDGTGGVGCFGHMREILMPDFSVRSLRKAIQLIYSDRVLLNSESECKEVLELVKLFRIFPGKTAVLSKIAPSENNVIQPSIRYHIPVPKPALPAPEKSRHFPNNTTRQSPEEILGDQVFDKKVSEGNISAIKNPNNFYAITESHIGVANPFSETSAKNVMNSGLDPGSSLSDTNSHAVAMGVNNRKILMTQPRTRGTLPPTPATSTSHGLALPSGNPNQVAQSASSIPPKVSANPPEPSSEVTRYKTSSKKRRSKGNKVQGTANKSNEPSIPDEQLQNETEEPLQSHERREISTSHQEDSDPPTDTDDIDYRDLEKFHQRARSCQKCKTVHVTASSATTCLFKHGGRVRCYFCFKICKTSEQLLDHYKRVHRQGKREGFVICPYCNQEVPLLAASCHVVAMHVLTEHSVSNRLEKPNTNRPDAPPNVKKREVGETSQDSQSMKLPETITPATLNSSSSQSLPPDMLLDYTVQHIRNNGKEYVVVLKKPRL